MYFVLKAQWEDIVLVDHADEVSHFITAFCFEAGYVEKKHVIVLVAT